MKCRRRNRPGCSLLHFMLLRIRPGRVRRKNRRNRRIPVETAQVGARFGRFIRLRPRVLHPSDFSRAKSHEPPSWTQHRLERADRMLLRRRPFSARFAPNSCQGRAIAGARIGRPYVPACPEDARDRAKPGTSRRTSRATVPSKMSSMPGDHSIHNSVDRARYRGAGSQDPAIDAARAQRADRGTRLGSAR